MTGLFGRKQGIDLTFVEFSSAQNIPETFEIAFLILVTLNLS
jgi:hypothetical protein